MRNCFSVLLLLIAYCTPLVLIVVPTIFVIRVVRDIKQAKQKHKTKVDTSYNEELPPIQRNTHYGVDL